jgi:uncharacterized protein YjdB
MEFYIESADRPLKSALAAEAVTAGELVDAEGGASPLASDGRFDGVATYEPEFLARDDQNEVADETYEADQRVPHGGDADRDRIKARTIDDENAPAPSIDHQDVVGVADSSDADSPDGADGRIVEEGYSTDLDGDGATTEFTEANGNFKPIGVAIRPGRQLGETMDEYDHPVRVEVRN